VIDFIEMIGGFFTKADFGKRYMIIKGEI